MSPWLLILMNLLTESKYLHSVLFTIALNLKVVGRKNWGRIGKLALSKCTFL